MCWRSRTQTARVRHRCSRDCRHWIEPGDRYVIAVHIPDANCSHHDADRDTDVDCGEDGFHTFKSHYPECPA